MNGKIVKNNHDITHSAKPSEWVGNNESNFKVDEW